MRAHKLLRVQIESFCCQALPSPEAYSDVAATSYLPGRGWETPDEPVLAPDIISPPFGLERERILSLSKEQWYSMES